MSNIVPVAPHMGAWIEIIRGLLEPDTFTVAPHMGAWIEISLKPLSLVTYYVAPHMGAWIEINSLIYNLNSETCRTPHGCVD